MIEDKKASFYETPLTDRDVYFTTNELQNMGFCLPLPIEVPDQFGVLSEAVRAIQRGPFGISSENDSLETADRLLLFGERIAQYVDMSKFAGIRLRLAEPYTIGGQYGSLGGQIQLSIGAETLMYKRTDLEAILSKLRIGNERLFSLADFNSSEAFPNTVFEAYGERFYRADKVNKSEQFLFEMSFNRKTLAGVWLRTYRKSLHEGFLEEGSIKKRNPKLDDELSNIFLRFGIYSDERQASCSAYSEIMSKLFGFENHPLNRAAAEIGSRSEEFEMDNLIRGFVQVLVPSYVKEYKWG